MKKLWIQRCLVYASTCHRKAVPYCTQLLYVMRQRCCVFRIRGGFFLGDQTSMTYYSGSLKMQGRERNSSPRTSIGSNKPGLSSSAFWTLRCAALFTQCYSQWSDGDAVIALLKLEKVLCFRQNCRIWSPNIFPLSTSYYLQKCSTVNYTAFLWIFSRLETFNSFLCCWWPGECTLRLSRWNVNPLP